MNTQRLNFVTAFLFLMSIAFVNNSNAQSNSVGTCNSCLSTNNLYTKNFKIANGITSATSNTATAWAHHNIYMESASVYNDFEFKKGVKYCVEIEFELTKQGLSNFADHKFNIRAANHLTPSSGGATPLPPLSNAELIHEELYSSGRFSLNRTYNMKLSYTPTSDFKQIWFYVTTTTNGPTARFIVKNVDIKRQGAKAHAKFANANRVEKLPSKYGQIDVAVLCLNDELLVDGSGSKCENRYKIRLSEFNLRQWTDNRMLYDDWISPFTQAPNNIKITDYLPQGYQLRPNKIYKFSLAVGIPWDIVDLWFKIDCCNNGVKIPNGSGAMDEHKGLDLKKNIKNLDTGN